MQTPPQRLEQRADATHCVDHALLEQADKLLQVRRRRHHHRWHRWRSCGLPPPRRGLELPSRPSGRQCFCKERPADAR